MTDFDVTSLSSRGQVVIPRDVRNQLDLHPGEKFVVTGHGDTVVLKRLRSQDINGFDELLKRTQAHAKKTGITPKDVEEAIKRVRRRSRH